MKRGIDSPLGTLTLVASGEGLTHLLFPGETKEPPAGAESAAARRVLDAAERQLGEYFEGRRREFDLPLAPAGTEFQRAVWFALSSIPCGDTTSYGELARRIGRPRAVRAVGAANGANPLPIVLPCHRVIGASGHLTGFGGGLPAKVKLLAIEGVHVRGNRIVDDQAELFD